MQRIEQGANGDFDVKALHAAFQAAKAETERPSIIAARTIIAWPAPNAQNTEASHGSALGETEVAATKRVMGFDPEQHFQVEDEVFTHVRKVVDRGREAHAAWDKQLQEWRQANPERAAEFDRINAGELPDAWEKAVPVFPAGKDVATRKASGEVLKALGAVVPELWGGSADLAGSNNTTIDASSSFLPVGNPLPEADPYGRTIHFGIREHAMGSTMNGIALHGNTRVYGGTFLVFSDYMRPAVRLAALMKLPVTYVWTHDSIGLGEDGPTHQPVEHMAALRAIPGLNMVRPADANETAIAWREIFKRHTSHPAPHGLALTRQNVPTYEANEGVAKGGYVLFEAEGGSTAGDPDRHRLRGPAGRRGPRHAPGRGHPDPRGLDAVRRVVRGAGPGLPRRRAAARRQGPGGRRGRYRPDLVPLRRRGRPDRLPGALRRLRRLQGALPRVRSDLRRRRRGRPRVHRRRQPPLTPAHDPVGDAEPMTDALKRLSDEGVAIWLDDLSRKRITSGNLAELIDQSHVVGVTTNPSIFQKAISGGEGYQQQLADLAARKVTVDEAIRMITTADVRDAADILRPVFDATDGQDGRVSIEVDPRLAHDTVATVAEAKQLAWLVDRPNTLIKIPATKAGLLTIAEVIGKGISVNVTLIFSLERYRAVMDAYLTGLEKAKAAGLDLSLIHSVASFFVSRVDTEIDKRLDALGTEEAKALRGKAALANARLAYQAYEEVFSSDRWAALEKAGANKQRALWASTGVKDPAYKDTLYVDDLVAPNTVNTMPEATLEATADHGQITGDTVRGTYEQAKAELDALAKLGISYDDVVQLLEDEGVDKFEQSWNDLLKSTEAELKRLAPEA
ncbi:hypothetical protein GCM10020000_61930 [Streptomyces olivoverticillatus]